MQFVNPINNKTQICNPYIYNKNNIKKEDLNKLLLYLQDNKKINITGLTLRKLRMTSYENSCKLLRGSNLKFTEQKVDKNKYSNFKCLDMTLKKLKDISKQNFLNSINNKYIICNDLVNLGYKFKDYDNIKQNINMLNISNITSTKIIENNELPMDILIKKHGINIYTHEKKNIYVPNKFIKNVEIDIVENDIIIEFIDDNKYNLKYKLLSSDDNIIKLIPKIIYDYTKLLVYLNNIYKEIKVTIPSKDNIIIWTQNNCSNYDNCNNKENTKLYMDGNVCIKNTFTDNYINISDIVQLRNGKCYDKNDIKYLIRFEALDDTGINITDMEKEYLISI